MGSRLLILVFAGMLCLSQASYGQNLLYDPESVVYDAVNHRYLVTNYGNGKVIQIDSLGVQSVFASGMGNSNSLCIKDSTLYVSTLYDLWAFNLNTGERLPFDPALPPAVVNFDGVTVDTSGYLYMVDTGGRIIKVRLSDGTSSIFVSSGLPGLLQDIVFDSTNNRLLVVAYTSRAPIQAVSLPGGVVTTLCTTSAGYMDGITIDRRGNVYVSHSIAGQTWVYPKGCTGPSRLISTGHTEPAGLDFNNHDNILAIPNVSGNRVDLVPVDFDPEINQWDFQDAAFGDGDGSFEPGETIEGRITVENVGFNTARGVTVQLLADDASLIITQDEADFGDISSETSAENTLTPFLIQVPANYQARNDSLFLVMTWNEGTKTDTVAFAVAFGRISLLLVDDDAGGNREKYYLDYLDQQRIACRRWVSPPAPTASDLAAYDIVIWYTGDYRFMTLDPGKIAALKGYLDGGGQLLLTGQGIAAQLSTQDPEFLSGYLKAQYLSTKYIPLLPSMAGATLFNLADTAVIAGYGGAGNQTKPDRILAVNGGVPELSYHNDTALACVSWSGDYNLIFMSFGFEAMINWDPRWVYRDTVYERILIRFDCLRPAITMAVSVTPGEQMRLADHTPTVTWSYHRPGFVQQMFHLQVGTDNNWDIVEMWDSGPISGMDTSVVYAGDQLIDGAKYYFRIQVGDGAEWSGWYYGEMQMNNAPTAPAGLIPDDFQEYTEPRPVLSHGNAADADADDLRYSYAVYSDSLLTMPVAQAEDNPGDPSGTTSWQVPEPLPLGASYFWRVRGYDGYEYGSWSNRASFVIKPAFLCGDANGDSQIDVGDAVHIISYVFKGGPEPAPLDAGDANCDGTIDVGDAVHIINYVFKGGDAPCCL